LSFGVDAALNWLPSKRLGARLQARYTPTYLHDASSDFCDPFGFCQDWLHQLELTGGVVVRFCGPALSSPSSVAPPRGRSTLARQVGQDFQGRCRGALVDRQKRVGERLGTSPERE